MRKPQLFDQKNSVLLNEMDIDIYCFPVLDLKDEIFINESKVKEGFVEVRRHFLDSKRWPFKKIIMPKSINH